MDQITAHTAKLVNAGTLFLTRHNSLKHNAHTLVACNMQFASRKSAELFVGAALRRLSQNSSRGRRRQQITSTWVTQYSTVGGSQWILALN